MSIIQTFGDILSAFGQAFEPLEEGLGDGHSLSVFLAEFGWALDPSADINVVKTALDTLPNDIATIPDMIKNAQKAYDEDDVVAAAKATMELEKFIKDVVDTITALSNKSPSTMWPAPLDTADFWKTFAPDLLEYLFYRYVEEHAPKLFAVLQFLGVLSQDYRIPLSPGRVAYVRRGVRWDRLVGAVTKP
ncbi:MAG TPA: hypothetical protein VHQ03_03910, partial [Candidatus Dormibacteraeota bacterium]|nr:hypothetical protein [Candidatus Dormibacteraeota bacterium]